jgi:hypothetical protein
MRMMTLREKVKNIPNQMATVIDKEHALIPVTPLSEIFA